MFDVILAVGDVLPETVASLTIDEVTFLVLCLSILIHNITTKDSLHYE